SWQITPSGALRVARRTPVRNPRYRRQTSSFHYPHRPDAPTARSGHYVYARRATYYARLRTIRTTPARAPQHVRHVRDDGDVDGERGHLEPRDAARQFVDLEGQIDGTAAGSDPFGPAARPPQPVGLDEPQPGVDERKHRE